MAQSSKINKYVRISRVPRLASCQPETNVYAPGLLQHYLEKHHTVFVKPDGGVGGLGVVCLWKDEEGVKALLQSTLRSFPNWQQADEWLKRLCGRRRHVIQRGVDLLPLGGNPVDIRTIVQRNRRGIWAVTGMFAKVAAKGKRVTNVKSGGQVISVSSYLARSGLSPLQRAQVVQKLIRLSVAISMAMARSYRNTLYALDLGVDRQARVWLIEINTHPSLRVLLKVSRLMYLRTINYRR